MTKRMMRLACRIALMTVLVAGTVTAQVGPAPSASPLPVPTSAQAAARTSGDPSHGITVHGHWTLTIRDADGSIAERIEFENALVPAGASFLASLLGRREALTDADGWRVSIASTAATYHIYEGTLPQDLRGPNDFVGLSVSVPSGVSPLQVVLVGSARATAAASITSVSTAIARRLSNGKIDSTPFTGHVLSAPATVVAGQTVDVTVVISFS